MTSVRTRSGGVARAAASAALPVGDGLDAPVVGRAGARRSRACRRCRRRPGRAARSRAGAAASSARGRPASQRDRRPASAAPRRRTRRRRRRGASAGARAVADAARPAGAPSRAGCATRERRCRAELAVDRRRAAVQLDQLLHQRQPDAGALVRAAARALDAVEALEHARQLVGRDADAGVAHAAARRGRRPRAAGRRCVPSKRELERVGEQVEDDLLPHVAVDVDRLGQRRAVDDRDASPARSTARAEHAGQIGGERARGRPARSAALDAAGLDAREVEQRVDQLQQPQPVAVDDSSARAAAAGRGVRVAQRSPSTGPSISVSGVRNSWLTLEKNAVFARSSSASASARRRSASYGVRIRQRGRDLAGEQLEEAAVAASNGR